LTKAQVLFHIFYGNLRRPPMVCWVPINMECKLIKVVDFPKARRYSTQSSLLMLRSLVLTDAQWDYGKSAGRFSSTMVGPELLMPGKDSQKLGASEKDLNGHNSKLKSSRQLTPDWYQTNIRARSYYPRQPRHASPAELLIRNKTTR